MFVTAAVEASSLTGDTRLGGLMFFLAGSSISNELSLMLFMNAFALLMLKRFGFLPGYPCFIIEGLLLVSLARRPTDVGLVPILGLDWLVGDKTLSLATA